MINIRYYLNRFYIGLLMALGLCLSGCSEQSNDTAMPSDQDSSNLMPMAMAVLQATNGNTANGSISFVPTDKGVVISARLSGLTPGSHGFHIHEKGDCSSGDGKSAGGHFNPENVAHGGPDSAIRHIGDLGNITADSNGNAAYDREDSRISIANTNSIIGKGVIIHATADDLTSQPTGAAGARVACGAIEEIKQ